MQVIPAHILAVGLLKKGPEHDVLMQYKKRLRNITLREIKPSSKESEGEQLLSLCPSGSYIIAMDEHGRDMKSIDFAHFLGDKLRDFSSITFIIGGADGLSEHIKNKCDTLIRLGSFTWPHMLVRGMLCEQIYRATLILNNHPYHRE